MTHIKANAFYVYDEEEEMMSCQLIPYYYQINQWFRIQWTNIFKIKELKNQETNKDIPMNSLSSFIEVSPLGEPNKKFVEFPPIARTRVSFIPQPDIQSAHTLNEDHLSKMFLFGRRSNRSLQIQTRSKIIVKEQIREKNNQKDKGKKPVTENRKSIESIEGNDLDVELQYFYNMYESTSFYNSY